MSTIDNETKPRSAASTWMFLAALAALLCVYLAIKPWRPHNDGGKHPAVGRQLPQLELQPLTVGAEHVSLDNLQGKVTLLNFWGTWCGPCVQEFPDIVALGKALEGNADFRLLPVSCGNGVDDTLDELGDDTRTFLFARKTDLPCYADQHGYTRRNLVMATGQQHFGYPTTVLLDHGGVIRGMWEGYSPSAVLEMRQIIDELLAK